MISRRIAVAIAFVVCASTVAACGTTSKPSAVATSPAAAVSSAAAPSPAFPAEVTDCGRPITFAKSPQRIVSLWPSITEMLIALGAGNRIAGQAFTDQSPPLPQYKAQYDKVKVLASDAVSRETLLAARPDLIVADGEYHFNGKELPTIADLNKLGIAVYIVSSFCHGAVTTGKVADVETDLTALGTLLGATSAADTVKAQLTSRLAAASAAVSGQAIQPLLLCQVFDKSLYAEAEGLYSDVVNRAGGKDIYDGALPANQYYAQVSVEDVAKKNPGTIVYLWNTDADKAATLKYLRATFPTVAAVRNNRIIALPSVDFIDMRAVDGVVALAAALHPAS